MKLNRLLLNITACLALSWATLGSARTGPTPTDAEAAARQAATLIRAEGAGAASRAFGGTPAFAGSPGFLAVIDLQGNLLAHTRDSARVGTNILQQKDSNGVEVIKMFTAIAREQGAGWSGAYIDIDPVNGHWLDETAYVERVGDAYVAVAVATDAGDISEGW
jgi:CubicO group peptidase (beta-lactamase class C family)